MVKVLLFLVLLVSPVWVSAEGMQNLKTRELIATYVSIQSELKKRQISTSGNNLTGDLAEFLFVEAFEWTRAQKSQAGYDAVSKQDQLRFQIKARRQSDSRGNDQLGAIRKIDDFDVLAVVIFDNNYEVVSAALVPQAVVVSLAKFNAYTNSYRLMFGAQIRGHSDVQDVTQHLRAVSY